MGRRKLSEHDSEAKLNENLVSLASTPCDVFSSASHIEAPSGLMRCGMTSPE